MKPLESEIVQVIVGTAGHVDHGKTALVKNLTGCDTDRLPEEKERGLSIDLGFAPCRLPGNRIVGIVDVPGHEDFIKNMVAGAASIDVLMLVVAADDSVMPQTVEHLQIVRLLRTPKVMAVVTKSDLVDATTLEVVRDETAELLARMGFPDAPVVAMSNVSGHGLRDVRASLDRLISSIERAPSPGAFRMNVERVFSAKGYGTVVTGIPMSGSVRPGDTLELIPGGRTYNVRAIQAYRHDIDVGPPNSCVAVNLRDLEPEAVVRGVTLAHPGVYRGATSVIGWMQNVTEGLALPRRTEVKFHTGTSRVHAIARLLGAATLPPGGEAFVHLKLQEPVVLAAGDRFIVRLLNPNATLGGGAVLSTGEFNPRRTPPDFAEILCQARDAVLRGDAFASELLAGPSSVLPRHEALRLTQRAPERAEEEIRRLVEAGALADLGAGGLLVREKARGIRAGLAAELQKYHKANPCAWGMEPAHVCRVLGLEARCFPGLSRELCDGGELIVRHGRLALPKFQPALSPQQMQIREQLLAKIEAGGMLGAARGNLVEEMHIAEADMKLLVRLLTEEGAVRIAGVHLIAHRYFEECRKKIVEIFDRKGVIAIPDFREATGVGRNLAVAILETFDSEGFTHRSGEGRVVVKGRDGAPARRIQESI